jgi:hypothetical protein
MFRTYLIIALLLLGLFGCQKRETTPKTDADAASETQMDLRIFIFPDISKLFATLEIPRADLDSAIPETYHTDIASVYLASFYLGTISADAIIATKARNKTKLTMIAHAMINYSKMVGISDEVLKLADELLGYISEDKWDELQQALDRYASEIEIALHETGQYDLMTLLQAGGWTEGINAMTYLLSQNYSESGSGVLAQKGIVSNLRNNLNLMQAREVTGQGWFPILSESFDMIYDIINVLGKETYSIDEIEKLHEITNGIKGAMPY